MNHFNLGRVALTTTLGWTLIASSLAQTSPPAPVEPAPKAVPREANAEVVVLPKSVPDPIEPLNRMVYAFNKGVMSELVKPTAKVYRFIVIKPVRTGIDNFGKNITYPGRLLNNLLQGKWAGARDETYRFGCNTTVGVAGFFDVGTKWNIPKSDADLARRSANGAGSRDAT
jgi:phospholipid-binding lipoprotein MlaA